MDNIKNDDYYKSLVIENINAILKYTNNISYENFINDEVLTDAVMFRLIQMVENINHISKDFKDKHKEIEWKEIVGFRNGLVHNYGRTDFTLVYEIVKTDLEPLRKALI